MLDGSSNAAKGALLHMRSQQVVTLVLGLSISHWQRSYVSGGTFGFGVGIVGEQPFS